MHVSWRLALAGVILLSASGCFRMMARVHSGKPVAWATATMGGDGINGTAQLTEVQNGTGSAVHVVIDVMGDPAKLTPGKHGIHFHAKGDCIATAYTSAGGHFDPGPQGMSDPDTNHPYHMGDLPNIEIGPDGRGKLDVWTTRVTLSDGPLSLFDTDGSAIILHKNPDQMITGEAKSGVSGGPRLACAVIMKSGER